MRGEHDIVTPEGAGPKEHYQRCNQFLGFVARPILPRCNSAYMSGFRCWKNIGRVRNRTSAARGDEERITEEKMEIMLLRLHQPSPVGLPFIAYDAGSLQ